MRTASPDSFFGFRTEDRELHRLLPALLVKHQRQRRGRRLTPRTYVLAGLPRLLQGRTSGPVFLADRRAPTSGRRVPAAADIDEATGRGRLSYSRAEYLFKTATAAIDPHAKGWTLHQLRHFALQHLAQAGRTAPELQAKSRHQHLASLGHYVRLGEETSARVTAEHDPAARHRTR
jgi:integrase